MFSNTILMLKQQLWACVVVDASRGPLSLRWKEPPSLKRVEHTALAVDAGAGTLDSSNDCLLLWTPQLKALELVGAESETC